MREEDQNEVLAREILEDVLSGDEEGFPAAAFSLLLETPDGEPIPVYEEASAEGHGAFSCKYAPLEAVVKIVGECARIVDEFTVNDPRGGRLRIGAMFTPAQRDILIRGAAASATHVLLVNMQERVRAAVVKNFKDSMIIANAHLAALVSNTLQEMGAGDVEISALAGLDKAAREAAEEERKHLEELLEWLRPRLVITAPLGRPPKVTTDRVKAVFAKRGKVTKEKLASKLNCSVTAITNWARSTEWGTYRDARAALLTQIENGKK